MHRQLIMTALAVSLLAGSLPLAHAQFADDTQSLFTGDPDEPKTKDELLIFDLDNPEEDEPITGTGQAQSVEELCCSMSAAERAADGLCFEAQCPAE